MILPVDTLNYHFVIILSDFMFTGIVQTQATVVSSTHSDGVLRLVVSVSDEYVKHLDLGASIAINGCCLTVVKVEVSNQDVVAQVHFDVIDETDYTEGGGGGGVMMFLPKKRKVCGM